jgi:hypothetical protein
LNRATGTEIASHSEYTQNTTFRETMMDVGVITYG